MEIIDPLSSVASYYRQTSVRLSNCQASHIDRIYGTPGRNESAVISYLKLLRIMIYFRVVESETDS
jgi:hypothetical protein